MFGLVNAHDFYIACERAFNPQLKHQPIVIVSEKNQQIIASSSEAKALGIDNKKSFYLNKALCLKKKITLFSANPTLYRDMSTRLMQLLSELSAFHSPDPIRNSHNTTHIGKIEKQTIHSAYIHLDPKKNAIGWCNHIQQEITKATGITISISIAPTKSLALIGSYLAQEISNNYIFSLEHPKMQNYWLAKTPVEYIIHKTPELNPKTTQILKKLGIITALDLKLMRLNTIKKTQEDIYQQLLLKTLQQELNGLVCERLNPNVKNTNLAKANTKYQLGMYQEGEHCHSKPFEGKPMEKMIMHSKNLAASANKLNLAANKKTVFYAIKHTTTQLVSKLTMQFSLKHTKHYTTDWQELPVVK